jgi:hypothetical protein
MKTEMEEKNVKNIAEVDVFPCTDTRKFSNENPINKTSEIVPRPRFKYSDYSLSPEEKKEVED